MQINEDLNMPKRCEDVKCGYLASDGSCLMPPTDLKEKCPARETTSREEKDIWMNEVET
jgi:hypothetical protein